MRVYIAGVANRRSKACSLKAGVQNFLLSYAAPGAFKLHPDVLSDPFKTMLVDSGAFSVWTKGRAINIDEYLRFALEMRDSSMCEINFVNLDVIPARFGRRPTLQEREDAAAASYRNFCYLRDRGLTSINVFHQHEDFKWLRLLADSADYIGISPANDVSVPERDRWLDKVFAVLHGVSQRSALNRTHGFGVTATNLLEGYPFFSVDSTTWMNGAKYGTFVVNIFEGHSIVQLQKPDWVPRHSRKSGYWLRGLAAEAVHFAEDLSFRYEVGMRAFGDYERYVTELWASKGVEW